MRTVLICHDDEPLNREGLARWLASFTDLAGVIVLSESKQRFWQRVRREVKRIGFLRFLDVVAFRVYYRLCLARADDEWETKKLAELRERFPPLTSATRLLHTANPNSADAEKFLRECAPDMVIARCKTLLKERIFSIPTRGTFVMHPGICPEYRNAHGCFWALAQNDPGNVGVTLLRIDKGVDTGPVYGHFRCAFDAARESHLVIQHRVVFDNLESLKSKLLDIGVGRATPLDTSGRRSGEWGQPWLTAFLTWRRRARRRK
jgi:hypothetical protein